MKKRINYITLLFLFAVAVFTCTPALAQDEEKPAPDPDAPAVLTASAEPTEVTIGDVITYTVTAIYDEEYTVDFMPPGTNLGSFEIREFEKTGPDKLKDGRMQIIHTYKISVYETGEAEIPPTQASYWKREDEKDVLETDPIIINVKSIHGGKAKDIQDIKAPLSAKPNIWKYIIVEGGAVLLLILLILFIVIMVKRSRRKAEEDPTPRKPKEPPHVIALRRLSQLEQEDLPGKGQIKEYYVELSEILRQYLGTRFEVPTMERTTDEILSDLIKSAMNRDHLRSAEEFLRDADMVKFAKYRPDRPTCTDDMARTRAIIEKTSEAAA